MVFSMFEDRLETYFWNCAYVHQWDVIPDGKEWTFDEHGNETRENLRPPSFDEHRNREIPKGIRQTGKFRIELLKHNMISQNLHDDIAKSEIDRKELIHRNMFYMEDLEDIHITFAMSLFRRIDKMHRKHKKKHLDKLT